MRRLLVPLLALAATAGLAPTAPAQEPAARQQASALLPGDLIRVEVYREPDIKGEYMVDEEGFVVLPLVGRQPVVGIPLSELRERLVRAYEAELRNPSIIIVPLRRVTVLGSVQRPGVYPVDPTLSLVGAIATAGGPTDTGDINRVRVIRGGRVLYDRVSTGENLYTLDVRSGDQIFVGRRSWFDRNGATVVASGISLLGGVVTALIIASN